MSIGIYKYKHLPDLANFVLGEHVEEFCNQQLQLSRQFNVPLLKFLTGFSDAQLLELTKISVIEVLTYLANNDAENQILHSLQKWNLNRLQIVDKYDIAAEDITLLHYVRGRSLKHFAVVYYNCDIAMLYELLKEIDDFILASTTAAANTYIDNLKDQLHEEEEFRSKLSSALPGFIYVFNIQTKKQTFSNNKLQDVLGYSAEMEQELSNGFYPAIIHPADWNKTIDCRKNYTGNKGSIYSFECRVRALDDSYKWLRYYETVLKTTPDGEASEIIGVAFDISGEKAATEALAMREAQLLEAQSIASIGSFEWDMSSDRSSTSTPEIFKIFELDAMGKFEEFMEHVHPQDLARVQEALNTSFTTGLYECDYRYIKNGHEKIIWSKGVVSLVENKPVKMIGTVQDITTIKRIEAELKAKTIELERSNESLQQFAAVASHDLKEPLRKISISGSKILNAEKGKLSEVSNSALSKIFTSTSRMQRMIDDILEFSFIDADRIKQQTDLEELLMEVKEILSENISNKKATIISDGLPTAFVIASQMRQLFQNLIVNAIKFSREEEPPVIRITHSYYTPGNAADGSRILTISVADNGVGFDETDSERLFDSFYRQHNKIQYEGTGLGLSICKKIVDKHSGSITATSKTGEGATFIITLPQ
ncbi:MAG TPA: ATP-binding protein [Segetibacter sp.]